MPSEISGSLACAVVLISCLLPGRAAVRLLPAELRLPSRFLELPLGVIVFLVSFSLTAKLIPNYLLAFPISILAPYLAARLAASPPKQRFSKDDAICFAIFASVATLTLYLHRAWPAIQWENSSDRAGVEKLFNLSLNQSFLFGEGFPPEWIWLGGEKASYYLLPRVLPGLSAWLARIAFGDPSTGGVQFLLWEAILAGLSASCVTAWSMALLGLRAGSAHIPAIRTIAAALGVFTFFAVHLHGVRLGLSALFSATDVNWWAYSDQVVRYTSNQYPVWLILLGDSHSYAQVIPFQLTLWALLVLTACQTQLNRRLAGLCGLAASAVFLAHFPSAVITLVVWGPAIAMLALRAAIRRHTGALETLISNTAFSLLCALILAFPNWRVAGQTKVLVPPSNVTSPLLQFLDVQFPVLLWIVTCLASLISARALTTLRAEWVARREVVEWVLALSLFSVFASLSVERPAIGIALCVGVILAAAAHVTARDSEEPASCLSVALALSLAVMWIFPELVAIDHTADNRTLWIRFNVVLRFWPEGYYLIPFVSTFCLGGALVRALDSKVARTRFGGIMAVGCLVFALSQLPAIWNRDRRSPESASIDGFRFLRESHGADWKVISYLARLPETPRVELGEACGARVYPGTPSDYAWPGRIAAFSGRAAPCGWARHALLFQPKLSNGEDTWANLRSYETAWLRVLLEAGAPLHKWSEEERLRFGSESPHLDAALATLRSLGITHLAYGELEQINFGRLDLSRLAAVTRGSIAFDAGGGIGVLKLDQGRQGS